MYKITYLGNTYYFKQFSINENFDFVIPKAFEKLEEVREIGPEKISVFYSNEIDELVIPIDESSLTLKKESAEEYDYSFLDLNKESAEEKVKEEELKLYRYIFPQLLAKQQELINKLQNKIVPKPSFNDVRPKTNSSLLLE